jgi:hypothetical protein
MLSFRLMLILFLPSVLFVAGAIFAPGRSLCRTLCALFVGGLHLIWSALIRWTNFWEGLSESSKFVARTAVGDDSVCHSVRTEEEASSCSSLHQQALAACIWGMVLLLPLGSKKKKQKKPRNEKPVPLSQGLLDFCFSRYTMLGSLPQLRFRHSHGRLLFKVKT